MYNKYLRPVLSQYVGPGKLVDYSWDNPGKAFVVTGLSLLVATYALASALQLVSLTAMEFNDPDIYDQLEEAVLDAAEGDAELAADITQSSWPSDCAITKDGKGGATKKCEKALEKVQDNEVIFVAIGNLQDLELAWADIGDAYNEYDEEEEEGWSEFTGGSLVANVYSKRPASLEMARNSAKDMPQEDSVSLDTLQAMAHSAVSLSEDQSEAGENLYDTMKEHPYIMVGGLLGNFTRFFILFIILGCLWTMYKNASGRNRTIWGFVIGLVALVLIGATGKDGALGALHFDVGGGVFETLLGPLLAVFSQALVFIERVVSLTGDMNTILAPLAISGILLLVLTWKSKWTMVVGVYLLLVFPAWLGVFTEGNAFTFSPFELDAFNASYILPPMVWLLEIIAMIVALHLLVGAWQHMGQRVIDKSGDLFGGGKSSGSSAGNTPHTPVVAPQHSSESL